MNLRGERREGGVFQPYHIMSQAWRHRATDTVALSHDSCGPERQVMEPMEIEYFRRLISTFNGDSGLICDVFMARALVHRSKVHAGCCRCFRPGRKGKQQAHGGGGRQDRHPKRRKRRAKRKREGDGRQDRNGALIVRQQEKCCIRCRSRVQLSKSLAWCYCILSESRKCSKWHRKGRTK